MLGPCGHEGRGLKRVVLRKTDEKADGKVRSEWARKHSDGDQYYRRSLSHFLENFCKKREVVNGKTKMVDSSLAEYNRHDAMVEFRVCDMN